MAVPLEQGMAHVVTSIGNAMAARRMPPMSHVQHGAALQPRPADRLLQTMQTLKTARFNAAARLERKHSLAIFAMSMVSLYFVGLSVWQTIYGAQLTEAANRLVTLVSIMSSIFTLVLALIEAMNDYRMKAHHMHACALEVNDLYHELKTLPAPDDALVQQFRRRYNEVVRSCPFNHTRVDFLIARAEQRKAPWDDKVWAQLRYGLDVYGLYGLCLIVPPLVLLIFH